MDHKEVEDQYWYMAFYTPRKLAKTTPPDQSKSAFAGSHNELISGLV